MAAGRAAAALILALAAGPARGTAPACPALRFVALGPTDGTFRPQRLATGRPGQPPATTAHLPPAVFARVTALVARAHDPALAAGTRPDSYAFACEPETGEGALRWLVAGAAMARVAALVEQAYVRAGAAPPPVYALLRRRPRGAE